MSSYEFKHLEFLTHRVLKGDKLTNEDYIFLTELREDIRIANENMATIDDAIKAGLMYC